MSEREWIARIEERELRERVRRVLCQLLAISEAPASKPKLAPTDDERKGGGMRAKQTTKHFESSVPRGAMSLYDVHSELLQRVVDDPIKLLRALYAAEHDVMRAKWGSRDWRKGKEDSTAKEREYESDEDFERRIITFYEGRDSLEVAMVYEDRHQSLIEKVRRKHDRDPETGLPRNGDVKAHLSAVFKATDEQDRYRIVGRLQSEGKTQREAAFELGVSNGTVAKYWSPTRRKAA